MIITGQSGLTDGAKIRVAKGNSFTAPPKQELASDESSDGRDSSSNAAVSAQNQPVDRAAMREVMQKMSPEERAKLRDMSREERRAFIQSKMAVPSDSTMTN